MKNTQKQHKSRKKESLAFCLSLVVIFSTFGLLYAVNKINFKSPDFAHCPKLTHYEQGLVNLSQTQHHHMELDSLHHPQAKKIQCHIGVIEMKKRMKTGDEEMGKEPEGKLPWDPFHPTNK